MTIESGTPQGTYLLTVTVRDDGITGSTKQPNVESTLNVVVKDVSREAVLNSGSIRFDSVTPENFVSSGKRELLQSSLASILNLGDSGPVDVFTVLSSPGDGIGTDVRYSVSTGTSSRRRRSARQLLAISTGYYTAEYLDTLVLQNMAEVRDHQHFIQGSYHSVRVIS